MSKMVYITISCPQLLLLSGFSRVPFPHMALITSFYTQPEQIRSAIMSANIDKGSGPLDLTQVKIGIDNTFFRGRDRL